MKKTKMQAKNLRVFFLALVSVLLVASAVSAAEVTNNLVVTVNGLDVSGNNVGVVAGETVELKAYFTSNVDASNIKMKAELEGDKSSVSATTSSFDVRAGVQQRESLKLKVPYELEDSVSKDLRLVVRIYNGEYETERTYTLKVQRPSYNADVMSISSKRTVDAGELVPVDIALKNIGYNALNDVYVTVKIPGIDGVERTAYFGDIAPLEDSRNDKVDTINGRLYIQIPYGADSGVYNLEVEVKSDDFSSVESTQIVVNNEFSSVVVTSSDRETVSVDEDAEFDLVLVNPTNKLRVYKVVAESANGVTASVGSSLVVVPAGTSKSVSVVASADSEGEHSFDVSVFSGEDLVGSTTLTVVADGSALASPAAVLTVILAIIFVVLLVIFIVLVGKKPAKAEEFGESYY